MYTERFQGIPWCPYRCTPESHRVPTFSDALSCAGGPARSRGGGGGARRFFMSDRTDTPEMLLSERDGPNVMDREFTDGEFGVVKQPCGGTDRHEMSPLRHPPCVGTLGPVNQGANRLSRFPLSSCHHQDGMACAKPVFPLPGKNHHRRRYMGVLL